MKRVVAALIVKDGSILICQRTERQTMPLKWEFPGGKIEPGESEEAALRRELEEELGIAATIGGKVTQFRHTYLSGGVVELNFFVVEEFTGTIKNRIFRDARWIRKEDLPDYDFLDADVTLVKDIASGKIALTGPKTCR